MGEKERDKERGKERERERERERESRALVMDGWRGAGHGLQTFQPKETSTLYFK